MTGGKANLGPLNGLLRHASAHSPFYQAKLAGLKPLPSLQDFSRRVPTTTLEELEAVRLSNGDPYSLRKAAHQPATLSMQLEYDTDLPLYQALDRSSLRYYAQALQRCWSLLGLARGDRVALFDFGSSPLVYLASAFYTPYLSAGAAEALGCIPVCNDGASQLSGRAVDILRFATPRLLFLRSDCLYPFSQEVSQQGLRLADYTQGLVVAENEGWAAHLCRQGWARGLGVPLLGLLRIDLAMFLGVECPQCHLVHIWDDLYLVEAVEEKTGEPSPPGQPGLLTVTNLFNRVCPSIRYVSSVLGSLVPPGCPRGLAEGRIELT